MGKKNATHAGPREGRLTTPAQGGRLGPTEVGRSHSAPKHKLCAALIALALGVWPDASLSTTLTGLVVAVADGDTLTLSDVQRRRHVVRLAGIDAPERRQPFGDASRRRMRELALGHEAHVEYTKRDRYGRIVGKVLVKGTDVGLVQLQDGLAWHFKAYAREQSPSDRARYGQAQDQARAERCGLWADEEPQAPWDHRNQKARHRVTASGTQLFGARSASARGQGERDDDHQ